MKKLETVFEFRARLEHLAISYYNVYTNKWTNWNERITKLNVRAIDNNEAN